MSNTVIQNEQSFKNFDLSEFYDTFDELINILCSNLVKQFENKITPILIPALLEYDYDSKLSSKQIINIDNLIEILNDYINLLISYYVDYNIIEQIFHHLFNFINGFAFNTLIFRIEMCNWPRGISLSYNVSVLEEWQLKNSLNDSLGSLDHLKQAGLLLMTRKTNFDIENLCNTCSKLNLEQIENILVRYRPVEFNQRHLDRSFIDKFLKSLTKLRTKSDKSKLEHKFLTFDLKKEISIQTVFNPSSVCLENVVIPEQLGLNFLIRA